MRCDDAIDAVEALRSRPDLFWGEEEVGRRAPEDCLLFESVFPALETRDGDMLARANEEAAALAAAPLALAVPAIPPGNYEVEQVLARWWMSWYRRQGAARGRNVAATSMAEAAA